MKRKLRLDELVVARGLAASLKEAGARIMAGEIDTPRIHSPKAGTLVDPTLAITLKAANPYVSRGGLKLEAALEKFNIRVEGKICMDIGASTGGFTDCLLQRGAAKVYAVDVGKNLLDITLKNDPRVISLENTNFRYFPHNALKERVEFVTIDVSFISLKKVVPSVIAHVVSGAEILALIKPQFEADRSKIIKGVVRDDSVRAAIIEDITSFFRGLGMEPAGGTDSAIKGPKGNREYFLHAIMRKT